MAAQKLCDDLGGILDWLGWARKRPVEELKGDVKEIVQATKTGFLDWFMGAKPEQAEGAVAKSKASPKKAREKREASEPLKSRRMSMAPGRQTLAAGRHLGWVGTIRRASKSGIEIINQEMLYDDRDTVKIEVHQLFDDKLGVRLRMEGLVVSNFDVPEAAQAETAPVAASVGWRFGDEIVAVNGKEVASREDSSWQQCRAVSIVLVNNTWRVGWLTSTNKGVNGNDAQS
eukprot:Skav223848  [mRNA]  locus=scaffold2304:350447:358499:+ [translate_table: standard]